jgi:hypothetical protein
MEGDKRMSEIRCSSLSKLAECVLYESSGGSSPAAMRGTQLDRVIRETLIGNPLPWANIEPGSEDFDACVWGVEKLRELSEGAYIETREEYLAMHVSQLSASGTADALCELRRWVADIKSGQIRNYREQLAGYSLACMDQYWVEEWTAHVLYIDHRVVRSYRFTREQAERMITSIVSRATSPLAQPTPCEYCGWCKHQDTCKALVVQSKAALADVSAVNGDSLTIIRDRLLADPKQHADFVARYKFFTKEFAKPLTEALRARLTAGEEVDGWKLTNAEEHQYIEPATALMIAAQLTPQHAFLTGGGKMSAEQFLELAAELGIENPQTLVKTAPGTKQMRQFKKKEK